MILLKVLVLYSIKVSVDRFDASIDVHSDVKLISYSLYCICAGVEAGKLQRISGANKRCWKHVEDGPERTWKSLASQSTLTPKEAKTGVVAQ